MSTALELDPPARALVETRAYLRDLPDGVASHPECLGKASIYRAFLAATPFPDPSVLPAPVAALVQRPPPHSAWVPEVHCNCLYTAARDLCFDDDDAFVAHFREVNQQLIASPMYRALFCLVSPLRLVDGGAKRMASLHRGLTAELVRLDGQRARVQLVYPHALLPRLIARCYATGFEVLVEAAGGKGVSARLVRHDPTTAVIDVGWR